MNVYEAWSAVMADVQAIHKGERNQQQNFSFRGIDQVLQAVGPALRKHGMSVVPKIASVVESERYQTARGGQMHGVVVAVEYTVYGPEGDSFTGGALGSSADAGDKAVPKAMSVAYRTFLLQALTVPTDDPDPDQFSHERVVPPPPPDPMVGARDAVLVAAKIKNPALSEQELTSWIRSLIEQRKTPQNPDAYYDLAEVINGMTDEPVQPEAVQS